MKKLKITINLIFFSTFFLLVNLNSHAEILKNIKINGNSRIADETIFSFLSIKINDNLTEDKINQVTRDLYETNFFKNVSLQFTNNELIINIIENPIIQNIIYNGIKSNTLLESVINGVNLIDRSSYVELYLEEDISLMSENLKNRGYYFSNINSKIEYLEDNKLNLIFNIELGNKAKIKKISFIGNKVFKDSKLRNLIASEEYKFWKFISGKKFLNENLVNFDKRLLTNFYINNGYYNVKINSSFAKIVTNENFELIFNIDAGEKIFFGELSLNLPVNYDKMNFDNLEKTLNELKNKPYSINAVQKITEEIDIIALNDQYESIDIDVFENLVGNNLNITFKIKETEKTYLSRINIFGNNVTRENVIRNQLEIDEGDFFNEILLNKSINNIKSLNFFKSVSSEVVNLNQSDDKIVNISVEEKPTGEIGATAGVGSSGESFGLFVRENNYLGKGLGVEGNILLSTDSIKGKLSINNPNFMDTDKSVYASLEATEIDKLKDFGYKTDNTGFSYGTTFEFLDDLRLGIGNKNTYQKIETDNTASALQKKQEGDYWDSFLNLDFIYDKRNQKFKPSDGFRSSYSIEIPLISETNTLSNIYDYRYYTELYEGNITSFSFFAKSSNSLSNDNIKLTERNFLPSSKLRGFTPGSIGPKDGKDYIGGNYATSVNVTTSIPQLFEESQNIDFLFFIDAANVWGVDYSSSIDESNKVRSAAGIGVDWFTAVGPLNFSLSQPITKMDSDSTESFRFNLGTTF
jgi:outer membrane protein insertion porin family